MRTKDFTYKLVGDGQALMLTAWWNPDCSEARRPIALVFHGGGFVIGSRFGISTQPTEDLANAGFVVISADYSLCPQVSLHDGPEQDAKDAYHWCKEKIPDLLVKEDLLVDTSQIVALGYSAGATLALCLGAEADAPKAIVDFYGAKMFKHSFWYSPLPMLSELPDLPEEFLNKVFHEPLQTTTMDSLEVASKSENPPRREQKGLPPPDLSQPRNAWLFSVLKDGSHLAKLVQDGDFERVDPANAFSHKFPPTMFIHGMSDTMILPELSKQAAQKLKEEGVATEIVLVPGASHGFDIGVTMEDPEYQYIKQAIDFLKNHI